MSRAKWKGPYLNDELLNQSLKKESHLTNIIIQTTSRNSVIINNFIGLTFSIYNGKTYVNLEITHEMVGHKFGEFIFTRSHSPPRKKKIKKKIAFKKKPKINIST